MYIDFSIQKSINFIILTGLLSFCLITTFSAKKYLPPEYFSIDEEIRSVGLVFQSVSYNVLFKFFDGNNKNLASVDSSILNLFSSNQSSASTGIASDIPVLVYHGIVKNADRFSMTPDTFSDQMLALKRAGYNTITLDDFYQFMLGAKTLPDKSFLLTFDDGRTDSYVKADPILSALGFHAVMFVATADSLHITVSSKSYYLDEIALHSMVDSGRWELGSHAIQENTNGGLITIDSSGTKGNFLSNRMWLPNLKRLETTLEYKARVTHELVDSKNDLEKTFGKKIIALSYPFSDYGQQTINNPDAVSIIADILNKNYPLAFQQTWPSDSTFVSNYSNTDDHHLLRVESGTSWSGNYLVSLLSSGHNKAIPFTDSFETDNGWRGTWGRKSLGVGAFHLEASPNTTGAFVFLDGTRVWDDYMYTADVHREKGSHISLAARFADTNNNVACIFSDDDVRIEQKVLGVKKTLVREKNIINVPYPDASLGLLVEGSSIKCYEGSNIVAYAYNVSKSLKNGGIGFQIWDKSSNNASLFVDNLQVVPISLSVKLKDSLPKYHLK